MYHIFRSRPFRNLVTNGCCPTLVPFISSWVIKIAERMVLIVFPCIVLSKQKFEDGIYRSQEGIHLPLCTPSTDPVEVLQDFLRISLTPSKSPVDLSESLIWATRLEGDVLAGLEGVLLLLSECLRLAVAESVGLLGIPAGEGTKPDWARWVLWGLLPPAPPWSCGGNVRSGQMVEIGRSDQGINRASTATAKGSGLQLQYNSSWALVLDAKRPIKNGSRLVSSCWKIWGSSLQSLESVRCRDSQSASIFSSPGRCSVWMNRLRSMHHLQEAVGVRSSHLVDEGYCCSIVQSEEDWHILHLRGVRL